MTTSRPHPALAPRPLRVTAALAAVLAAALVAAAPCAAQSDTARRPVELSGVIFGGFQYHVEPGTTASEQQQVAAGLEQNQFSLDRAYLTATAAAGPKASVRLTSDLYRGTDGYQLRLKYGYLDYHFLAPTHPSVFARVGVLQNVMVDFEERFWPRWLGSAPLDRAGYFASADLGLSTGGTLPGGFGEVYAEVVNGQGYQHLGDTDDRFKDYAARLTLRPFAGLAASSLRRLTVTPWYYRGDTASVFGPNSDRASAPGYLGPVADGRRRDRYGVFLGWDDPRATLALSLARRESDVESGDNTALSPVTVNDRTAELLSTFAVIRPFAFTNASGRSPLALVFRYDQVDADARDDSYVHYVVGGLLWDLNSDVSVALDYQETLPQDGQAATRSNTRQIYFAHFQAKF